MASRAKRLVNLNFKALFSLIMAIVLVATVFCIPMVFSSAENIVTKSLVEIEKNAKGSSIVYYNSYVSKRQKGAQLGSQAYYVLTMDYKVLSGTPSFKFEGRAKDTDAYVNVSTRCASYNETNTVVDGISTKTIKFRIKKNNTTPDFKITIGVNDNSSSVLVGTPILRRYESNYTTRYDDVEMIKDLSEANITDKYDNIDDASGKTDIPDEEKLDKDGNKNLMWTLQYDRGQRDTIINETLTEAEYKDKFVNGTDKYMLSFLEGGQNVYAEYEDKSIELSNAKYGTNIYKFTCDLKTISGVVDLDLYTSSDGGKNYTAVTPVSDLFNEETNSRAIRFKITGTVNAFKVIVGNKTDKSDVSFVFASPMLIPDTETASESLIVGVSSSTYVLAGLSDETVLNKWNLRSDSNNAAAIVASRYEKDEIYPDAEAKKYENKTDDGNGNKIKQYIEYNDSSIELVAGKNYVLEADLRIMDGDLNTDTICNKNNNPAFNVYLGGKTQTITSDSTVTQNIDYDRQNGKLKIYITPNTTIKGIRITAGASYNNGVIRIGNVKLVQTIKKSNNVNIIGKNLIKNINSETYCKKATPFDGAWVNVTSPAPELTSISDGDFLPESGMIRINKGCVGNRAEYVDNTTVLKAGTTYKFSINYRVYNGEPSFKLGFKKIDGVDQGEYVWLKKGSNIVDNFLDVYDTDNYIRSITFTPKTDMSIFKIVIGNEGEAVSAVDIANAKMVALDSEGLASGLSVVNNINDISIVRNTSKEKVWNVISTNDADAEIIFPIPQGVFFKSQLIRIKEGTSWNRVVYEDNSINFEKGKSYIAKVDYRSFTGEPSFSIANVKDYAKTYSNYVDSNTSKRIIKFTMDKTVEKLSWTIGNSTSGKNTSMLFANPELYEVDENGQIISENLVKDITQATINDGMNGGNIEKAWNLRYSDGNRSAALSIEDIPDNYFRTGALSIKGAQGNVVQVATVKSNQYYCLSYSVKNYGTVEPTAFVKYITGSGESNATLEHIEKDTNGNYNYYCEFKTPSTLKEKNNLKFGVSVNNSVDSLISNVSLCEMDESSMESTNVNLVVNSSFAGAASLPAYSDIDPNKWMFEGTIGSTQIVERASTVFEQTNSGVLTFSSNSYKYEDEYFTGYQIAPSFGKETGTYSFTVDLAYLDGTTPKELKTTAQYQNTSDKWIDVTVNLDTSSNGKVQKGTFEVPADVKKKNNTSDSDIQCIRVKIENVDGSKRDFYVANGEIKNTTNSTGNLCPTSSYVGRTMALTVGKDYDFSLNLKYASSGYIGETGIVFEYLDKTTNKWTEFSANVTKSATEFKSSATFTVPSNAAATGNNVRFRALFSSQYVSGYISNAVVTEKSKTTNLIENGDFTAGTSFWDIIGNSDKLHVCECPDGYFLKSYDENQMIVYRNTASWVKFVQELTLKQNTYYKVVCEQVNPWGIDEGQDQDACTAIQLSGVTPEGVSDNSFNMYTSSAKDKLGMTFPELDAQTVSKNFSTDAVTVVKFLYTTDKIKTLNLFGNAKFYLYMECAGTAGIWGKLAMYECDEHGNILSNNVLINSDFNFGTYAWDKGGEFTYRLVDEPDNYFKNYKTYDDNMVVSGGTETNARLGQYVEVEKGKTYYLSAYYMNMNSNGVTPKIFYTDKKGNLMEATLDYIYDSDRYYYETAFTLPSDAKTFRNKASVFVCIDNANMGKGYLSTLRFFEEGSYESLFVNTDFSNGFAGWTTSGNYTLAPYDASVFVFYYDDKKFDDGDWSGELATIGAGFTTGTIKGSVYDNSGSPVKNLTMILKPGNIKVKTNSNGEYTFENVKPGSYDIYIQTPAGTQIKAASVDVKAGYVSTISKITFDKVEEDDTTEVDTSEDGPTTGIIRGYLFDAYGYPLKGYTVYLGNEAKVVTGKKGAFEFSDVKPGKYDLYTKIDGEIVILKTVEITAGKGIIVKLRLPEEEESYLWLIILIAAGAVVVLGAGALTTVLLIKRKKKV